MAIEIVPTKVSDMNIEQLVRECTERDPDRWWVEGDHVALTFDGYFRTLAWDDFSTCAEAAFRNHLYAGVCSSLEEIARSNGAEINLNHVFCIEDGKHWDSFSIRYVRNETPRFWIEFGDNRAGAALRAFVSFLRSTT